MAQAAKPYDAEKVVINKLRIAPCTRAGHACIRGVALITAGCRLVNAGRRRSVDCGKN